MQLSTLNLVVIWWSDVGVWVVVGFVLTLLGAALAARFCLGVAAWRRLLATLPVVGPLWQWCGLAQFLRLLSVLVEARVPLPDAVRLAGDAVRDVSMDGVCERIAERLQGGCSLTAAIADSPAMPSSLLVYVRWGEAQGALAESLAAASELYEGRVRFRALALRVCIPPLLFVAIAAAVAGMFAAVMIPLIHMMGTFWF
jgi:general secretion pathway protein F